MATKRLYKSEDKILCGVCGGLAEYGDADPTLIRILTALAILIYPLFILGYLIACMVMPSREEVIPSEKTLRDMTKDEIEDRGEDFGVNLTTNDTKDEMIEQFLREA